MRSAVPPVAETPHVVAEFEEVVHSLVVMIETVAGVLDRRLGGLETALRIAGDAPEEEEVAAALAALDVDSTDGCVADLGQAEDPFTHLRGRLETIGLRGHSRRDGDELNALATEFERAADDPAAVRALADRLRGLASHEGREAPGLDDEDDEE